MSYLHAQRACGFFLSRLEGEVSRLRAGPFPGHDTGPRKWLNFISGLIRTAKSYLDEIDAQALAPADVSRIIQEAENIGNTAYRFLQTIAGADATQIPHEVVAPFQRWVKGLDISNTIFFRSEHLPNYELFPFDLSKLSTLRNPHPDLVSALTTFNSLPVLRVTVPGLAMGMLPHFAVVAHELGHAIQNRIVLNLATHMADAQACNLALDQRFNLLGITRDAKVEWQTQDIIGRWLNELRADAVGFALVGPAFFFALSGFLELSNRGLGIATTHPPSDLRRQLLLDQLRSGTPSFSDVFEKHTGSKISEDLNSPHIARCPPTDQLFAMLNKPGDPQATICAAICAELVPLMKVLGPTVYADTLAYMRANCPDLIYSPADLERDLTDHLLPLCKLIPPIESRRNSITHAVGLSGILNVGWAALLGKLNDFPDASGPLGNKEAQKMENLHELLLKAVELSEARQLWDEQH